MKPIAGLYKGQVYALARELGLPEAIASRQPTTETFQLPQTPGGVLLRPPLRAHGRADVGARARRRPGRARRPGRDERRGGRRRLSRDRAPSRSRPAYLHAPAVLVVAGGLTCAGSRASSAPIRPAPVDERALLRMARAIRHRGPDGFGLAARPRRRPRLDAACDLRPPARLAAAAERSRRRRPGLQRRGLQPRRAARRARARAACGSRPRSDTEVVLRLLEREGLDGLERLNGQFAFAWWQPAAAPADARSRPLRRAAAQLRACSSDGTLVFGSEAKALFASGEVRAARRSRRARRGLHALGRRSAPRTAFAGVRQLQPGGVLVWERGEIVEQRRWWRPEYRRSSPTAATGISRTLLRDSVRLRLRADVPVGAYLSGGLDSSLISALAQVQKTGRAADLLGRLRRSALRRAGRAGARSRGRSAPPTTSSRSAPTRDRRRASRRWSAMPRRRWCAPRRCRSTCSPARSRARSTVVATGEGADELFWGYDLFKEVAIRELHRNRSRAGAGAARRALPAPRLGRRAPRPRLGAVPARDRGGGRPARLPPHQGRRDRCRPGLLQGRARRRAERRGGSGAGFGRACRPASRSWDELERAAWLEVTTLLEPYLLAAQGDRVAMAHGVEGRYPFLDHRVFARSVELPDEEKLDRGERQGRPARGSPTSSCRPRSPGAGSSPTGLPRSTPFFVAGRPGLGRGGAFAGGARRDRHLGRRAGRGPAAALPRRPGHRRARGDGADRDPVDPALASRQFVGAADAGYPAETADPRGKNRPDGRAINE